jgi:hypothetical protein
MLKGKNKCKRKKIQGQRVREKYILENFLGGGGLNLFFRPINRPLGYCIQWVRGFVLPCCSYVTVRNIKDTGHGFCTVYMLSVHKEWATPDIGNICYLPYNIGTVLRTTSFFLSLKYVQRFSDNTDHYLKHKTQNTSIITILLILIRKYKRHFHDSNHYIHLKHL